MKKSMKKKKVNKIKKWLTNLSNLSNRLVIIVTILLCIMAGSLGFIASQSVQPPAAVTTQFPNKIQEVLPTAVHIMCDQWQGSGVAITKDIVVTARHVIDGVNYTITMNDGNEVSGIQAISHKDYDIGFIGVSEPVLTPAKFGPVTECVLGDHIFIIGSPYGKINFNNVTLGIISGLDRDWDGLSQIGDPYGWKVAFITDSGAHPGNSGGPVFSMDGVVRGLLVGGYSPVLNCSMPCDLFLDDLENIKMMFTFNKYQVVQPKIVNQWTPRNSREDDYQYID